MLFIFSPFKTAYQNIALEHYLIHYFNDEFLILYINESSVVIGKHQNAFAEANFTFIKKNKIPIARRISGGGAVYHDEGNLNISLILNSSKITMSSFLFPIIYFLKRYDLNISQNKKNDILINNKKITGTAAHIFKSRSLHHGTLLINASINYLNQALFSEREKFISKSIASKPSPVTNLLYELNQNFTINEIVNEVKNFLCNYYHIENEYTIKNSEIKIIEHFVKTKYSLWEWNYGYSPAFTYNCPVNDDLIECYVVNGIIYKCYNHSTSKNYDYLIGTPFDLPFENLILRK